MRICYPLGGQGCHVIVSEGYFDGFNDDYPESNLKGLSGATFTFDGDFNLSGVHYRNGTPKDWEGTHLNLVIELVRDWARDQNPPKVSGFFTAPKNKVEEVHIPPLPKVNLTPPAPQVRSQKNSELEYLGNHYVVRRRKAG